MHVVQVNHMKIYLHTFLRLGIWCISSITYRVLTVIDAVVYTVVLPKKEFDVEVFVQIRFILLYNHNIN